MAHEDERSAIIELQWEQEKKSTYATMGILVVPWRTTWTAAPIYLADTLVSSTHKNGKTSSVLFGREYLASLPGRGLRWAGLHAGHSYLSGGHEVLEELGVGPVVLWGGGREHALGAFIWVSDVAAHRACACACACACAAIVFWAARGW